MTQLFYPHSFGNVAKSRWDGLDVGQEETSCFWELQSHHPRTPLPATQPSSTPTGLSGLNEALGKEGREKSLTGTLPRD